jgi:hypothetical protein
MSELLAVLAGGMVGCAIASLGFRIVQSIKRGQHPRRLIGGVLVLWLFSFAVTALLFKAISIRAVGKAEPDWSVSLILLSDAVLAIAPATMALTLFLWYRTERRYKNSQQRIQKADDGVISESKLLPPSFLVWERFWRAVFGGIIFIGLVALNAAGPGLHLSLSRSWDVCLLKDGHSAPAIVVGYFLLLASFVPRRWLNFLKK